MVVTDCWCTLRHTFGEPGLRLQAREGVWFPGVTCLAAGRARVVATTLLVQLRGARTPVLAVMLLLHVNTDMPNKSKRASCCRGALLGQCAGSEGPTGEWSDGFPKGSDAADMFTSTNNVHMPCRRGRLTPQGGDQQSTQQKCLMIGPWGPTPRAIVRNSVSMPPHRTSYENVALQPRTVFTANVPFRQTYCTWKVSREGGRCECGLDYKDMNPQQASQVEYGT